MSTPRKLGVFLCLLGFAAVCVLALTLNSNERFFAGLGGIQSELAAEAEPLVAEQAPGAIITAEGRDLTVVLPDVANPSYNRERLLGELEGIDGVRSVELVGEPDIALSPDDVPAPEPTEAPEPEPAPEPTEAPEPEPTAVPTPEPTEAPEPEPAPEPTPEPVAPTLTEVVDGLDLSPLEYEPGTARLTAGDTVVLDTVADQLQGLSGGPVQVQAHTSNIGDPDVNLLLSQDRADAVVAYLTDRGVDASLLTARGFGAQAPIADNSTEQGRAANERVVLVVEGN